MPWPLGPSQLKDLFAWPKYNAEILLKDSALRQNFLHNCKYEIRLNDAYSGMGTASWTLHSQHKHMCSTHLSLSTLNFEGRHNYYM